MADPAAAAARLAALCGDLEAEHAALDDRVASLDDQQWQQETPAEGWAVRDQISHLNYYDGTARMALTDPAAFKAHADDALAGQTLGADTELGRTKPAAELLSTWRSGRGALLDAVRAADPGARVPWYGPPMSLASFVTARLMETWAHGQDVADGLGLPPVVSDRLRHVCHIGVGARAYSFLVNQVDDPGDPIRVEATAPGGELWTWGPDDAPDRVTGSALDLALVLTQRRHREDTDVRATGPTAELWLSLAQAFAGPAGPGRKPGEFG